jgi:hypothetical protein
MVMGGMEIEGKENMGMGRLVVAGMVCAYEVVDGVGAGAWVLVVCAADVCGDTGGTFVGCCCSLETEVEEGIGLGSVKNGRPEMLV